MKILSFSLFFLFLLPSPFASAAETHYRLHVDGLVCPFCAYNIEKKLGKLDGVEKVIADLKNGLVYVQVADGKKLPEKIARKEIIDAGFTLRSIDSHVAEHGMMGHMGKMDKMDMP